MSTIILKDFIEDVCEKTTRNNEFPVLTSSQEGIVSQESYFNKQVASKDNTGYKIIRRGQFTYRAMSDTGRFYINQMSCCDVGIVSPSYPVFKVCENDVLLAEYLAEYFHSDVFQSSIALKSRGSTRVSLKLKDILNLEIEVPPIPVQRSALKRLGAIHRAIETSKLIDEHLEQTVKSRHVGEVQEVAA